MPNPSNVNSPPCTRSIHPCHLCGLRSFGSMRQNVRKSITKMISGWIIPTVFSNAGPAGCNAGIQ